MRTLCIFLLLTAGFSMRTRAQTLAPVAPALSLSTNTFRPVSVFDSSSRKKWTFSKYTSLSASYLFFNGGSASVFSAPMGLQVSRKLTNTMYAFGGVSIAPAYINFNNRFLTTDISKTGLHSGSFNQSSLGLYSRAELGLMYVNPEKTFSISGSIGIEQSSSPVYYSAPRSTNHFSPQPF